MLNGVSIAVGKGEFITLLGPSGCGKTTTLRIIAGLETPDAGRVLLNGQDVTDAAPDRRDVNTVFQNYALFPHMTVAANIGYSLRLKRRPKAEIGAAVEEALALVQLSGYGKRMPSELSGGQRQRVAIARAVVNRPSVLLLDEPLGALDLQLRRQMQHELKALQKQLGITFVYITHDQEEALNMSDRIAVMRDGVILQMDSPMEMYDHPKSRFVADFLGESNILFGKVAAAEGSRLTIHTPDGDVLATGQGFGLGEEICVSIRSEYLNVSKEPVAGFSVKARVKDFIYVGTVIKTNLDLPCGQEIKLSRFEHDASLHEGDEVYIHWDAEKAVAIHDDGAAEVRL